MEIAVAIAILLAIASVLIALRYLRLKSGLRALLEAIDQNSGCEEEALPLLAEHEPEIARLRHCISDLISSCQTIRQAGDAQLAHIELAMTKMLEAVIVIDPRNCIYSANAAACSLLGIREVSPEDPPRLEAVIRTVDMLDFVRVVRKVGAIERHECRLVINNEERWFETSGSIIRTESSDRRSHIMLIMHDVTALKRLERVRRDFVANVSHELRTPVTVIKGFSDALLRDHRKLNEDDRERFLLKIHKNVERFYLLLEDLLALSSLESESDTLNIRQVSVATLVLEAVEAYESQEGPWQGRIHADVEPATLQLECDAIKLGQVLSNLLENAVRYARGYREITIRAREENETVVFCIEDDGCGIPKEDLPHLFERFYRVDKGRSRESGGTGLGLSIVKHIILMHGGQVRAESEIGRGTRIFFSLPVRRPQLVAETV